MNRVVVLGAIIVAVVVAIIAVGILLANHQNNNYTPTSTMTNNGTNIIPNTNTATSSTNTTTNVTTNIPYNTFYFLNKTNSSYYYIFVLSYNEYTQMMSGIPHAEIINLVLLNHEVGITKTVVVGNYAFLIGYTYTFPLNVSIGQQYPTDIHTNFAYIYTYWLTYEGNWTGPIP
jgi:hypothetical protein